MDSAKPGDRIAVVGIYKPLTSRQAGHISAVYKVGAWAGAEETKGQHVCLAHTTSPCWRQ
mgnify:CR=1 FL=1